MTLSLPHVLMAAALVLTACGNGDGDDTSAPTTPATTTASPATSPAPTTSPPDDSVRIAVVDGRGRVVLLDGDSGDEERVLMDGVEVDDPSSLDIAVSPDRSTVFVVRPGASAEQEPEIVQVAADGGAAQVVTSGRSPAISPDGGTLAYVRLVDDPPAGFEPTLRLRDLDSGDERALTGGDFYAIQDLAWTAAGEQLAFTAGEIRTGVHVMDRVATSLAEARRLGPEDTDGTWSDVAALSDGRLAVIERCCQVPDPNPDRWRILAVDPRDGATGAAVLDRRAVRIDARADGEGLLVIQDGGPGGGTLLRWHGSGQPRELADDVLVAAW